MTSLSDKEIEFLTVAAIVGIRLGIHIFDVRKIRRHFLTRKGRVELVKCHRASLLTGFLVIPSRIYDVAYIDSSDNTHKAICTVSLNQITVQHNKISSRSSGQKDSAAISALENAAASPVESDNAINNPDHT